MEQSCLKQCGCHCHPRRTTVTATPLFFGRWRVERMMIGDFNLSTKTFHTSFIHVAMLLPSGALDSPLQRYLMPVLRPRYSCSTCENLPLRSESVFPQLQHVTFRLPAAVHDLSGQCENQFPDGWSKLQNKRESNSKASAEKVHLLCRAQNYFDGTSKKITSESRESLLTMPSAGFLR